MTEDPHPLIQYGEKQRLSRRQTAADFGIEYGTFRQLVSAQEFASITSAENWELSSNGLVKAIDVMRWQQRSRERMAQAAD